MGVKNIEKQRNSSCFINLSTGIFLWVLPTLAYSALTWEVGKALPQPRCYHAVACVNETLYVIGGVADSIDGATLKYDFNLNSWLPCAPMPVPVNYVTEVGVWEDRVYITGGWTGTAPTNLVQIYNPSADSWSYGTPMPESLFGAGVAILDSFLYVIGGTNSGTILATCYRYNFKTQVWESCPLMLGARTFPGTGVIGGKIYAIGGIDTIGSLIRCEEYNPETETWMVKDSLTIGGACGIAVLGPVIYAIGGGSKTEPTDMVESYVPEIDVWNPDSRISVPRIFTGVSTDGNKVYAVGGGDADGYIDAVEKGEVIGPTILYTTPPDGAVEQPTDTEILVKFDRPLDSSTVDTGSVYLYYYCCSPGDSTPSRHINGEVIYTPEDSSIRFRLTGNWMANGQRYWGTITTDIMDTDGMNMQSLYRWCFETMDYEPYGRLWIKNGNFTQGMDWWNILSVEGGITAQTNTAQIVYDDSMTGYVLLVTRDNETEATGLSGVYQLMDSPVGNINYLYLCADIKPLTAPEAGFPVNLSIRTSKGEWGQGYSPQKFCRVISPNLIDELGLLPSDSIYSVWVYGSGRKFEGMIDNLILSTAPGGTLNIALIVGGYEPTKLIQGLSEFSDIGVVDYFDASSNVPTLSYLQNYDAVITWQHYKVRYLDRIATGDTLAIFVDSGGGVVCAGGCWWDTTEAGLGGRIMDEGYNPFQYEGENLGFPALLGWMNSQHPIMAGVDSLRDRMRDNVRASQDSEVIAKWDDGEELVGKRGSVVGINILPSDSNFSWSGDVAILFHNALAQCKAPITGVDENLRFTIDDLQLKVYPNPFRGKTVIKLASGTGHSASGKPMTNAQCPMTISIYDLAGCLVKSFVISHQALGGELMTNNQCPMTITWDGKDDRGEKLASGVYFVRLTADEYQGAKKIVLVR